MGAIYCGECKAVLVPDDSIGYACPNGCDDYMMENEDGDVVEDADEVTVDEDTDE